MVYDATAEVQSVQMQRGDDEWTVELGVVVKLTDAEVRHLQAFLEEDPRIKIAYDDH